VFYGAAGDLNSIEGFMTVDDGSGTTKAYTVGPANGPILATQCVVTPGSPANLIAYSVINKTLILLFGLEAPLYWHYNSIPARPDLGPFPFPRDGINCQPGDLTPPRQIKPTY
jgi:hypothetical protein